MGKQKQYKCCYCKEIFDVEDIVEFESGKVKRVKKRACRPCKARVDFNKLYKDKFYKLLMDLLQVKQLDKTTYITLEQIQKQYNWEVMYCAVNSSQEAIKKNIDKPAPYFVGIIRNQLPYSERDLEKEKTNKIKTEEKQSYLESNFQHNDIELNYKPIKNSGDISNLFD